MVEADRLRLKVSGAQEMHEAIFVKAIRVSGSPSCDVVSADRCCMILLSTASLVVVLAD